MFANLEVFKMSHAMAVHAGHEQAVTAQNVANADTPDYKARSVVPFSDSYRNTAEEAGQLSQKSTRMSHLHGSSEQALPEPILDRSVEGAPNGNTVSLENEMLKSLNAKRQHDRALAIYKSSMTILRAALSRA